MDPLDDLPGALPWRHATRVHLQTSGATELLVDTALAVYGAMLPSWSTDAGEDLRLTTTRTPAGWSVRVSSSTQGFTLQIRRSAGYHAVRRVRAALALIIAGSDRRLAEAFARTWGVRMWSCEVPGCSRRFSRWSLRVWHERVWHRRRMPTA